MKIIQSIFNIVLFGFEKIMTIFLIVIPEDLALFLGKRFGDFLYFISKITPYGSFMEYNVRNTFYGTTKKEAIQIIKKGLKGLSLSLVEVFRFPLLNKNNFVKKVSFSGLDNLENAFNLGKGAIIASAHFGNWELLAASFPLLGYPFAVVVQDQINPVVNSFMNGRREKNGVTVISRYQDLRLLVKLMKRKYLLGMLVDQHGESNKVFGKFFGKRVSFPEGPAVLNVLCGCPIIPVFIIRQANGRHCIHFEEPIDTDSIKETGRDKRIAVISQLISDSLEKYILRYPEHWNWFYNRWDKLKE